MTEVITTQTGIRLKVEQSLLTRIAAKEKMGEGHIGGDTTLDLFLILTFAISFSHPAQAASRVGQHWKGKEWKSYSLLKRQ